jgi:hypothetical protein
MSNNEQNKEFWVETEIKAVELAIAAKALRTSFNTLSTEIMKFSYMDDDFVIGRVRRIQTEYKLFHKLLETLKDSDRALYDKEFCS